MLRYRQANTPRVPGARRAHGSKVNQTPELVRFVLLPSGESFARFSDCSLVSVNPCGGAYLLLEADGTELRGSCACATSTLRPRLRIAMKLRNVLSPYAPRVFWDLLPANHGTLRYFDLCGGISTKLGSRSSCNSATTVNVKESPAETLARGRLLLGPLSWPRAPSRSHIVRHSDGAVRVLSLDRRAWLLLHPEGHSFCVCFPVCAGAAADVSREMSSGKTLGELPPRPPPNDAVRFVFCTQLHSALVELPLTWHHPLDLARAVARAAASASADGSASGGEGEIDCAMPSTEPGWRPHAELLYGHPPHDGEAPAAEQGTTAPLPPSVVQLVGLASAHEAERRWMASGEGGDGSAAVGFTVDGDVLRIELPKEPSGSGEELRLHVNPSIFAALSATPLDAELPAEGARLVLTPHALFRLRQPTAKAPARRVRHPMGHLVYSSTNLPELSVEERLAHHISSHELQASEDETSAWTDDATPPPLSLTILCDETHLMLASSERFWYGSKGAVASLPAKLATGDKATCGNAGSSSSVALTGAAGVSTASGLTGFGDRSAVVVYAVGAVPPVKRYSAVTDQVPAVGSASLRDITAVGERLAAKSRSLPRCSPGGITADEANQSSLDPIATGGWAVGLEASSMASEATDDLPAVDPAACLEESIVDGLGRFRLFGDGRVSVLFDDSTVLTMRKTSLAAVSGGGASGRGVKAYHPFGPVSAASWLLCDVLFPDGRTCTVRSTCPVGAEGYVHAAVQFRAWATKPYSHRVRECEHHLIEQEKIGHELSRIQRHLVTAPATLSVVDQLSSQHHHGAAFIAETVARRTEEARLANVWLGGRAQVAGELGKLERALALKSASSAWSQSDRPATDSGLDALPWDIDQATTSARARTIWAGSARDELSKIELFLERAAAP